MAVKVIGVEQNSYAADARILPGDLLISINDHDIYDVLDYRFYMTSQKLSIRLCDKNGNDKIKNIRKDEYDDLGLEFETYLMDNQRFCKNKCVFCFIDQLPPGMRDSLYFKDDDSRLSFLFGNYVTLTNLSQKDVSRIIDMRISPINISVHTTNPDLRVQMMANPNAGKTLEIIPTLVNAGISVNAQLVLCPGFNDGVELTRSLTDLTAYAPLLQSLAVVPVGLTRYRDNLKELRLFTPEESGAVIDEVDRFGNDCLARYGERICYASDEWYLSAKREIPLVEFYESLDQLENGVGMLALLMDEFRDAVHDLIPKPISRRVCIATGTAAAPFIKSLIEEARVKLPDLNVEIFAVRNNFFGQDITVAGLITGGELISQLEGKDLADALIIPADMLRSERDVFLDDVSLAEVSSRLGVAVLPIENDGRALLDAITGLS